MIDLADKTLYSQRLSYRFVEEKDKERMREIVSFKESTVPAGYYPPLGDDFEVFFDVLKSGNNTLAVLLNDRVIGYFRIYSDENEYQQERCVSIGYVLDKQYHNQGYGREMLQFLSDYLKEEFNYVFADVFTDNPKGLALIEKCGFKFVEEYRYCFPALNNEIKTCRCFVK